jgi:hypothetical protein
LAQGGITHGIIVGIQKAQIQVTLTIKCLPLSLLDPYAVGGGNNDDYALVLDTVVVL